MKEMQSRISYRFPTDFLHDCNPNFQFVEHQLLVTTQRGPYNPPYSMTVKEYGSRIQVLE